MRTVINFTGQRRYDSVHFGCRRDFGDKIEMVLSSLEDVECIWSSRNWNLKEAIKESPIFDDSEGKIEPNLGSLDEDGSIWASRNWTFKDLFKISQFFYLLVFLYKNSIDLNITGGRRVHLVQKKLNFKRNN